jgi:hypothetical protein
MNLYDAVCANIAKKHTETNGPVIILEDNKVNNGGNIYLDNPLVNTSYKVILPTPLRNKAAYSLHICDAANHKKLNTANEYVYSDDENDIYSFFLKFLKPIDRCYILLNQP